METILKGIFVGGLTLSAFLIGKDYGVYETNEEYKKIIVPYMKEINEILLSCVKTEEK